MRCKVIIGIVLTLFLIGMLTLMFNVQPVRASGPIYIKADGSVLPPTANITSVDNITYTFSDNNYDTIIVERDNIVVDGAGYTLQGTGGGTGISLWGRSNVTVKNVRITTSSYGIGLGSSSNNKITGNNIANNFYGITLSDSSNNSITRNNVANNEGGIRLEWSSDNNSISENNITANNYYGIELFSSSNNSITRNNITANTGDGIRLYGSSNNVLRDNVMTGNNYNFGVEGSELSHFINDVDASNTIDGKPIVYLINQQNIIVDPQTYPNIGYLAVVNSTNITVQHLNIKNNGGGVLFAYTNNSLVQNVTTTNNDHGIGLYHSSNNRITGNNITNSYEGVRLYYSSNYNSITGNSITANNGYGIRTDRSLNNSIYHNDFVNNTQQVFSYNSVNVWDDGYPSGGNYWSDYTGVDLFSGPNQDWTGSDGIGDTPYVIDTNNKDNYPLMSPFIVYFTGEANFSLQTMYNVTLKADLTLYKGTSLVARFHTYSGVYEGNVTVWTGTTPNSTVLSMNIRHPLDLPVEIVTLVLTDDSGNIWGLVTTFVVHRSDLMNRDMWLDQAWIYGWMPKPDIFREIIDKDGQWPYAPP